VASSRSGKARRFTSPGLTLVSLVTAAFFALPLAHLALEHIGGGAGLSGLFGSDVWGPLSRSLLLATLVSACATLVGTAAAWLVMRTDLPGRRFWRVLLPIPLVIPSFIGAFVLVAATATGGFLETFLEPLGVHRLPRIEGLLGSVIVLTLFTYPYVYLPVAARLGQMPSSLEESARILGARPFAVFRTVVIPQARSAMLAGALLVFLYSISDFGVVVLMRFDALTRAIYATRLFDREVSIALSLVLGLVAIAVVLLERGVSRKRPLDFSGRRPRPLILPLQRWRAPALALVSAVVFASLVLPISVLVWWALRGMSSGATGSGVLVSSLGSLVQPALATTVISVAAAIISVAVVLPLAYLIVRHRSRVAGGASAVVVAGFALPGLAIALSLASFTLKSGPMSGLYQTFPLLLLAYVVHFGAQAMKASQVAVAAVPAGIEDAGRVLGVSRWQRFWRLEMPIMRPGLLAGGGLVLLSTMKELPASLLLAPAGFQTLAMRIWGATESAYFADASVLSLTLIALSGVLTWLLVIRRADAFV
jgi:iron(III) transport system permease protein